jgi:hypothetical protein
MAKICKETETIQNAIMNIDSEINSEKHMMCGQN